MIAPLQKDEVLLADIMSADPDPDDFCLWWLGQSGFLFKCNGAYTVIDPYLSDSLTSKYESSRTPHVRMTGRCLDPRKLGFVDLAITTHGHTDHFDAETLRAIAAAPNRTTPLSLIFPAAIRARGEALLEGSSANLIPVDAGHSVALPGITVSALSAAHPTLDQDPSGHHLFLGYVLKLGRWTVYHSGDTIWHEGVVARAVAAKPDIALLPINGHAPERGVAGNLDGTEAACFAKLLGVTMAIPHHFEMFEFNTAPPDAFDSACRQARVTCKVLRCGERWTATMAS